MEALESATTTPAPAAPTPQAVPAATTPAAAPVVDTTAPVTNSSNTSGDASLKDILKSLNWVEVGFGVLGSAALYYMIYYYKYNINTNKIVVSEMQNKIDELTIKVSDISSVLNEKESSPTDENPLNNGTFI
jgi:hypothetical protein